MSRIGKKAISIPENVTIDIQKNMVQVRGKYGSLDKSFLGSILIEKNGNELKISQSLETKAAKAYHGLARVLLQNMITGVNAKFSKVLITEGVGYKFQVEPSKLTLSIGFSHPVALPVPAGIFVAADSSTKITLSGIDKEQVGLFASKIRAIRPPEPYKGKGIRYENEKIKRKAGKTKK